MGQFYKFSSEEGAVLKTANKKIPIHNQSSHSDSITVVATLTCCPHVRTSREREAAPTGAYVQLGFD